MISIWEKETFFAQQDVIIAGGGLVGLWSAFYLKKQHPKLKITILDRGIIPTGASTRNAGFACFGSLSELVADRNTMGEDKMLSLVAMRYKGLKKIQKYFNNRAIDFKRCGGYELYKSDDISTNGLEKDMDKINDILKGITGTKKTFKQADAKIKEFGFAGTKHLIQNNSEGYLHSGKLVQCLLVKVQSLGVQVLNSIEIKHYDLLDDHIELTTNRQLSFSAKQLLICTNAFAKELLPEEDIVPARGQIIVTSPIKHLPFSGTFHSEEGYYYFRDLGNKVLLGGARHKAFAEENTTEMAISDFIQTTLQTYLDEVILPRHKGQYIIEHRWSGIMGMGGEKMPLVKEIQPRVFCAVRMSGMGVALSPVIGQKVADMMFG